MVKKLYVGGISWNTTDDQLRAAFAQAGNVISAIVIKDKFSGRSKGFGFVEMEEAEANEAIEMWNGKELDGRNITVNEARPMEDRPPRRDNFSRGGNRGGFGGNNGNGGRNQY
jgi:RNA recognition motif-containing protein